MTEFSPELTSLSPIFSRYIFFNSTFDPEKSIASLSIFLNFAFVIFPSPKSISILSEQFSSKEILFNKNLLETMFNASSEQIYLKLTLFKKTLVLKKLTDP